MMPVKRIVGWSDGTVLGIDDMLKLTRI